MSVDEKATPKKANDAWAVALLTLLGVAAVVIGVVGFTSVEFQTDTLARWAFACVLWLLALFLLGFGQFFVFSLVKDLGKLNASFDSTCTEHIKTVIIKNERIQEAEKEFLDLVGIKDKLEAELVQERLWMTALARDFNKVIDHMLQRATLLSSCKAVENNEVSERRFTFTHDVAGEWRRDFVELTLAAQRVWGKHMLTLPDNSERPVFDIMSALRSNVRPDVVGDIVDRMIHRRTLPADPDNPQPWEAALQHYGLEGPTVHDALEMIAIRLHPAMQEIRKLSSGRINIPEVEDYDWYQMIKVVDQLMVNLGQSAILIEKKEMHGIFYADKGWEDAPDQLALDALINQNNLAYKILHSIPEHLVKQRGGLVVMIYELLQQFPRLLVHFDAKPAPESGDLILHQSGDLVLHRVTDDQACESLTKIWVKSKK